jgi:hypothetical protein
MNNSKLRDTKIEDIFEILNKLNIEYKSVDAGYNQKLDTIWILQSHTRPFSVLTYIDHIIAFSAIINKTVEPDFRKLKLRQLFPYYKLSKQRLEDGWCVHCILRDSDTVDSFIDSLRATLYLYNW